MPDKMEDKNQSHKFMQFQIITNNSLISNQFN